ncbi:hypothetical protein BDY19DRAFT_773592 [Irpex rosettiformis]|uniref:Uncharacterized protein n=1 Tax=Irpex rosettiformis TaxID=378272 RepID=A0ACB8U824_9APHY|nr:hypothetical protein BDY19DRAFT_773592 [Irpex rosettiformis]
MIQNSSSVYEKTLLTTNCLVKQFIASLYTQTHNFESRDLSIDNATSFIIIVSIGFVAFVLLCAATSIYYRRRMMLGNEDALLPEWTSGSDSNGHGTLTKPEIWDVSVDTPKGFLDSSSEGFKAVTPLAARIAPSSQANEDADSEADVADGMPPSRMRRWGLRFNHGPHTDIPNTTLRDPLNEDVEVAMLISMPSASKFSSATVIPHTLASRGNEGAYMHPNAKSGGSYRSDYVIGVLQAPYPREAEKPDST